MKSTRRGGECERAPASASASHGVALRPPDYGIGIVDDGEFPLIMRSPEPGSAAGPASAPASAPAAQGDPAIAALQLEGAAKAAAILLKQKHPEVVFTSGYRTLEQQASAMAHNVVKSGNRQWIAETYAYAPKLQQWVDEHPEATTHAELKAGLLGVLQGMTAGQRNAVSKHLTGRAFDVQPISENAEAIVADIKAMPGLTKFFDKEGNLTVWHAQFKRAAGVAQADDPAELVADRVARQIVEGVASDPLRAATGRVGGPARHPDPSGPDAGGSPDVERATAGGQPLASPVRAFFEERLGHDLGRVRVHTDGHADASARALRARAYTIGPDVVFRGGAYAPGTATGLELLAHELVHVVQQGAAAPVATSGGSQGPAIVQRKPAQDDPLAVSSQRRDPTSAGRKRSGHSVAEYIAWVREVEAAYPGRANVVQRLRRLYYSAFTRGPGRKFDLAIDTADAELPLTSPPLSENALYGLLETDYVVLPDGARVDVSHLLVGLDVDVAGLSMAGGMVERKYGVGFRAVATWAGDLASWFVEWQDQLRRQEDEQQSTLDAAERHELLLSLVGRKVDKDDLLGNLDVEVASALHTRPTSGQARELTLDVSQILESMYFRQPDDAGKAGPNRFDRFVANARPQIPHVPDPARPGKVLLAPQAKAAIHETIRRTAWALLDPNRANPFASMPAVIDEHDRTIWDIAHYFECFLTAGLEEGDAPWPQ